MAAEELKEEVLSVTSPDASDSGDVSSSGTASSDESSDESSSGSEGAGSTPVSGGSSDSDASDVSSQASPFSPDGKPAADALETGAAGSVKRRGWGGRSGRRPTFKWPTAPKLRRPRMDCITAAGVGKFLLVLGPLLVVTGLVMSYMIHKTFPGQIKSAAVIDSTHHPRFKAWASNAGHGGAPRFYSYTFQHVTNPEEVINKGEPPIYVNKGPYVFDRKYKRVNVQFEEGGNVVTFAERLVTTFDAKRSQGFKADDAITMVNPAWHQVVSVYRSETGLSMGSGSLILQKIARALHSQFIFMGALDSLHTGLKEAYGGMSLAFNKLNYPPSSFEAAWGGNCVSNGQGGKFCGIKDASVLEYSGLLRDRTSLLFEIAGELCAVPGITEHAIPPETAKRIWDANDEYSILNLTEEGPTLTRQGTFHGLFTWVQAANNETARDVLIKHFRLSRKQVDVVAQHIHRSMDSEPLFEELKTRYLATVPDKRAGDLAAHLQTREDLIWRQMYAADVLPALKKDPNASLKKDAKFEFGLYAKSQGKTVAETGMSLENLKCMFQYVVDNRVHFEAAMWGGLKRDWFDSGKVDDITGEMARNKPPPQFALCFPDVLAVESAKGYVKYLIDLLFVPEYTSFQPTDGFIATKSAQDWILGHGPLELFAQSLLDEDDPRINFAFLSSDPGGLDGQNNVPYCHQSSDVVSPFMSCYRDEAGRWLRGNYSMYTGKDNVTKVGQWKRLNAREVVPVWGEDMPIDNGAAALAELHPWQGRKPLLPNHIDGLAVPPGLLDTAPLEDTYLSFFMDSIIAPFPLIYERDVVRKGIRLKRFVFHPDALSDRRPDAEVFAPVVEDAPMELKNTLNVTLARGAYFFIGPKVSSVDEFNPPGVVTAPKRAAKHGRVLAEAEVDGTGAIALPALEAEQATAAAPHTKLRVAGGEAIELERKKSPSDDVSYIEFEPITGMAMKVNIVFQAYLSLLPAYLKHDVFTPEAWEGPRVPFYEVRIAQEASDGQAREYKLKVAGALKGADFARVGGMLFGSMAFVAGAFLLSRQWLRKRRRFAAAGRGGQASEL